MSHNSTPLLTKFPTETLMLCVLVFVFGMGVGVTIGMTWIIK